MKENIKKNKLTAEDEKHKVLRNIFAFSSIGYLAVVYTLAFFSFFYSIYISRLDSFALAMAGITVIPTVTMTFSRRHIVTRIISIAVMPALLPIAVLYFGQWFLIIPICAVSVIIFFTSGASEKSKTVWGTVFLLFYVVGAFGYFVYSTLLVPSNKEITVINNIVSQSQLYKYYVTDAAAESTLGTKIYVEPNTYDIDLTFIKFEARGYKAVSYCDNSLNRKPVEDLSIEWRVETRDEVVAQMLRIGSDFPLNVSQRHRRTLGYGEEEEIFIKDLSSEDLDALEIPLEGDVLYVDGTARFRFVTNILADLFDIANRQLAL
ncbi:MAG: hypothetical protein LBR54_00620 [Oscillospiraceae bacterium]|jgi:hypothetical protein|nr:hypothetical protein [Oscillospiraceae bacterium]